MCRSQVVWVSCSSSELEMVHGNQGSSVNKRSRLAKQRERVKRAANTQHVLKHFEHICDVSETHIFDLLC